MDWLTTEEAGFYAAVWVVAFLVSVFRTISTDHSVSIRMCIGSSGVTAFFAFSAVSFFIGKLDPSEFRPHFYYLGLASLIGLAGPFNQKVFQLLLKKFGLDLTEEDGATDKQSED